MTGATLKKNLRTGRSLWADSAGLGVPVRPLTEAISVDVAIVGAGISGAFMAHALSRDHSVAVLDRRPPLTGSTVASTALLQWEIDLPLTALADRIGMAKARRAYLRSRSAVDALKRIVARERIICGLKDKATLYLAGDEYGHRALETEAAARAAIGLESDYIGPEALRERFGVERTGAIVSQGSASADPARLAAGLLRRAQANGTKVYSRVEVMEAASDPDGVTLLTDAGHAVRAKRVVFCCGYEFPKGVPTPGAKVISTWALASRPRQRCPAWLRETLVWEASDPYLYFRMGGDGRIIVGGEDEADPDAHADAARLTRKCETIVKKLHALLPGLEFEVDYSWAGAFGESATGLPSIAPVPDMDHAWAVMGFGGNGITYSVIASQVISTAIRGGSDPDADLYQP
ncbi:MAG: FAD-binding oxidoreductase [Alphaproteobacteria bacterium]|jgi:glycine/D-amino acid oxidase-like deaminating enzyme|nr:FAD-binding oxidoreductase [Alphaproteobacteria bacterium]MBU2041304.1 FAD-binding oxidoreductase [Alphaproteobacteria bacterium]MBU2127060.1 FAD-binding oxidoreductase [Alphaproteobacteria bacterium]MBU2208559.1 FAD-binding oxidoreductase [Alphaproteobacteria bacterium]MBU2291009.1 FAD-binding oxidoreductase [Alphaproteobacteria bacterium]